MQGLRTLLILWVLLPGAARSADYAIERHSDGPFSFKISSLEYNEGSTLARESILFNDPKCPVSLTSHSTKIDYKSRGYRFIGATKIHVNTPVVALRVRTILYDVFGQHMKNLSNVEPKDFSPGAATLEPEWRASDNEITELPTTVTYVSRVRLADGSQWVFDQSSLSLALSALKLEQKISDADEE